MPDTFAPDRYSNTAFPMIEVPRIPSTPRHSSQGWLSRDGLNF